MAEQEQNQKSEETQSVQNPLNMPVASPSQPPVTQEGPRAAMLPITISFLESLLPKETKILAVKQNDTRMTVDVVITHPSFAPLKDGELPPEKSLIAYRATHIERMEYQG